MPRSITTTNYSLDLLSVMVPNAYAWLLEPKRTTWLQYGSMVQRINRFRARKNSHLLHIRVSVPDLLDSAQARASKDTRHPTSRTHSTSNVSNSHYPITFSDHSAPTRYPLTPDSPKTFSHPVRGLQITSENTHPCNTDTAHTVPSMRIQRLEKKKSTTAHTTTSS